MEQKRKAPATLSLALGLEPSLLQVQVAGAAGRGQEGLEEANKGTPRPLSRETRETREERGPWQCF